ncbi:MAG: hypothetical protein KIT10_14425 [Flavobacteriales bacterium]|nr:hypothetical protein [Flavobacteriales bacterium]
MARPCKPRYVLSTYFDGKRLFLHEVARHPVCTTTYHTPSVGMAMHLTKYMAEKLRQDLSSDTRQYDVEPLHLS